MEGNAQTIQAIQTLPSLALDGDAQTIQAIQTLPSVALDSAIPWRNDERC